MIYTTTGSGKSDATFDHHEVMRDMRGQPLDAATEVATKRRFEVQTAVDTLRYALRNTLRVPSVPPSREVAQYEASMDQMNVSTSSEAPVVMEQPSYQPRISDAREQLEAAFANNPSTPTAPVVELLQQSVTSSDNAAQEQSSHSDEVLDTIDTYYGAKG